MNRTRLWYLLAAVAAVVVLAASWFLLVAPARDEAATLRSDTEASDAENAAQQAQNVRLKAQFEKLPELKTQLAAMKIAMPDSPRLPDLVRAITSVANASGVKLVAVNPSTPTPGATMTTIPVQIDAQGAYANLSLFVRGLETLPRSLLLQEVSISRDQGQNSSAGALSLTVQATAFVAGGATEAPDTTAGANAGGNAAAQ